jgi:hypothetical protein
LFHRNVFVLLILFSFSVSSSTFFFVLLILCFFLFFLSDLIRQRRAQSPDARQALCDSHRRRRGQARSRQGRRGRSAVFGRKAGRGKRVAAAAPALFFTCVIFASVVAAAAAALFFVPGSLAQVEQREEVGDGSSGGRRGKRMWRL